MTDSVKDTAVECLTYETITSAVDTLSQGYAVKSVALTLTMVRAVLDHGVRQGLIPQNFAHGISAQGKAPTKRQGYTPAQLRSLSQSADGDRLTGVWAVILLGLRRSEVLGLRWSDIASTDAP